MSGVILNRGTRGFFLKSERRGFSLAPRALHHRSIPSTIHANDYNCVFSKNSHETYLASLKEKDHSNQMECEGYDDDGNGHEQKVTG